MRSGLDREVMGRNQISDVGAMAQAREFRRIEMRHRRQTDRTKKRRETLNKWYKEMKYIEIKKVLIRLKSRKFLT